MATAKNAAVKKLAAKQAASTKTAVKATAVEKKPRAPNAAFMKALTPSASLAAVVGEAGLPRTEVIKKLWEYIKSNELQDSANKRMINADDKLMPIFGKPQVTMFELTKLVSMHLT